MSLRFRLTLFFTLFFALMMVIVAIAVYTLTERSLIASVESRARQSLDQFDNSKTPQTSTAMALTQLPDNAYFEPILYPNFIFPDGPSSSVAKNGIKYSTMEIGGLFVRGNPTTDDIYRLIDLEDYEKLYTSPGPPEIFTTVSLSTGETLYVLARVGDIPLRGEFIPAMFLVGIPESNIDATLGQLKSNLTSIGLFSFIIMLLGGWLLASSALFPVKRVTKAAASMTSRDLSQRLPVPKTHDELRELAITLNSMLDRLQESFETQRRFTADASHELRTPVTAISGHASYLLRRTNPSQAQQESLDIIRHEADRMGKLVSDLLELARADAGFTIKKEPMNLLEVLEAVHLELAPVAGGTDIHVIANEPVYEVEGDRSRLHQVVLNLVQNALNAGSKSITLSLSKERDLINLEVLDDGSGIPEEAIPHLFDRFFRVDGARSTRGNGSGLGLSIVKWIVQQHDGSVSVTSKIGEGTAFTITLKANKESDDTTASTLLPAWTQRPSPQLSK